VEPDELPWFERDTGDESPGSTCFKYNFKPVQLLSQISTTSYLSLHLDGNLEVTQQYVIRLMCLQVEHGVFEI